MVRTGSGQAISAGPQGGPAACCRDGWNWYGLGRPAPSIEPPGALLVVEEEPMAHHRQQAAQAHARIYDGAPPIASSTIAGQRQPSDEVSGLSAAMGIRRGRGREVLQVTIERFRYLRALFAEPIVEPIHSWRAGSVDLGRPQEGRGAAANGGDRRLRRLRLSGNRTPLRGWPRPWRRTSGTWRRGIGR